jgi:ribosome maturation factor RimP
MQGEVLDRIRQMADEVATREGCAIYDLEFVGAGGSRVLRIYIDKADGGQVSIEDCANVSRGMNLMLDVDDVIPGGQYSLEVSSPGVERVLRVPWHFQKAIGQTIALKTFAPLMDFNPERADLAKARTLQGKLEALDDKGVKVSVGGAPGGATGEAPVFVPFESITKAHTVFEYAPKGPPKGGPGKKKKK